MPKKMIPMILLKSKEISVWTGTGDKMFLIFAIPRKIVAESLRSKRKMLDFEMEFTRMEAFDLLRAVADVPHTMEMMKNPTVLPGKKSRNR